jgi:hypothetical protein
MTMHPQLLHAFNDELEKIAGGRLQDALAMGRKGLGREAARLKAIAQRERLAAVQNALNPGSTISLSQAMKAGRAQRSAAQGLIDMGKSNKRVATQLEAGRRPTIKLPQIKIAGANKLVAEGGGGLRGLLKRQSMEQGAKNALLFRNATKVPGHPSLSVAAAGVAKGRAIGRQRKRLQAIMPGY